MKLEIIMSDDEQFVTINGREYVSCDSHENAIKIKKRFYASDDLLEDGDN